MDCSYRIHGSVLNISSCLYKRIIAVLLLVLFELIASPDPSQCQSADSSRHLGIIGSVHLNKGIRAGLFARYNQNWEIEATIGIDTKNLISAIEGSLRYSGTIRYLTSVKYLPNVELGYAYVDYLAIKMRYDNYYNLGFEIFRWGSEPVFLKMNLGIALLEESRKNEKKVLVEPSIGIGLVLLFL